MCGVFATTRLDLWRNRVDDVLGALRHRGPDAEGCWIDEQAGVMLVHTRLAIVGLGPEGRQPHKLGSSVLAYNGEVYNHTEVAKTLKIEPPACDTETVHEVLRQRGVDGLSLLDGMFAMAWWDPGERRLVIARDHWGIKPLYVYRHADGGVTVASELAALALLRPAVDPYGLAHYVAFGHTTPTATVYERITKLPPGTHADFRLDGNTWRTTSCAIAALEGSTQPLGDLVEQSVRDQLMADVPLGVFLSGGVDSTLIAAAAANAGTAPRCFTLSFPDSPEHDESAGAARNAARLDLAHTLVPATTADLVARAEPLMRSAGGPIGDGAALAVDLLSEQAAKDVKVVLTGEGADEMFGGYVRHGIIRRLAALRAEAVAPLLSRPAELAASKRGDRPWQRATVAALQGGGPLGYATLEQAELSVYAYRDDLRDSLIAQLRADWELAVATAGTERAALAFDQRRWLPNTYLEKIDRATMRHGLEGRVPYLGAELTAWARRERPAGKDPLVDELTRLLPGCELPSRKKGLVIELRALLRCGLDTQVDRVLGTRHSVLREAFGEDTVSAMRERARRSPTFAYRLATVAIWEEVADVLA
ncbi:MAG: asparagine synthase (glutamine-hydrolyzing) [Acidimicrobiia bacterium]